MNTPRIPIRYRICKWLLLLALLGYSTAITVPFVRYVLDVGLQTYIAGLLMTMYGQPLFLWCMGLIVGLVAYSLACSVVEKRRSAYLRRSETAAQQAAEAARFAAMSARAAETVAPTEPEPLPHEALHHWAQTAAGYVPRARRSAVYLELMDHLLLRAESLGSDEAAIAAMGDVHQVGCKLRRDALAPSKWPQLLRAALTGRGWTTLYSGEDSDRFARLHHALSAAGIEFQADELDAVTQGITAVYCTLPPGMWGADTSVRRAGAPVSSVAGHIMTRAAKHAGPTRYTLRIRKRDLTAAKRLVR